MQCKSKALMPEFFNKTYWRLLISIENEFSHSLIIVGIKSGNACVVSSYIKIYMKATRAPILTIIGREKPVFYKMDKVRVLFMAADF